MSFEDNYHNLLKKVIEECSYDFYVVHPDQNTVCSCFNSATKQADSNCKKCLGTGYKISIRKAHGASYDEVKGGQTLMIQKSPVVKNYFVDKAKFKLYEGDYIFDNDEIYYVFRIKNAKGLQGFPTHQEVMCSRKNNDRSVIYTNFNKILDHYYKTHKRSDK